MVLVDGVVRALWAIERQKGTALLTVKCFSPLGAREKEEVTDEGVRLLRFAAGDAERHEIRFAPVDSD